MTQPYAAPLLVRDIAESENPEEEIGAALLNMRRQAAVLKYCIVEGHDPMYAWPQDTDAQYMVSKRYEDWRVLAWPFAPDHGLDHYAIAEWEADEPLDRDIVTATETMHMEIPPVEHDNE